MQQIDLNLQKFIIQKATIGISIVDKNGRLIMINEKHAEYSGEFNDRFLGAKMSDLVDSGLINASSSQEVFKTKRPVVLEQIVHPGKANEKAYMAKSIPCFDEKGEIQYVVNYLLDINEKNKLLKELEKAQFDNEKYSLELKQIRNEMITESPLVYRSKAMENLHERINKIAGTNAAVLITGETGTGKTLLAKHIHSLSARSDSSFLTLNCGAIPHNLIESELFGYEKGAFSGANASGKKGIFEYADGGTLLLDEIGEMPYDAQVKLLGVLQNGQFYRIGGRNSIQVDVRIIAATNANLVAKIEQHLFREDLYYRLNVISFRLPPLREREEDIPFLIEHICLKYNKRHNLSKSFAPSAVNKIMAMNLRGNVRELENIIERNMLFSLSDIIIDIELYDDSSEVQEKQQDANIICNSQITKRQKVDAQTERAALIKAYLKYGTTAAIAKHFGVSQPTISRKLNQHKIDKHTLFAEDNGGTQP